MATSTEPQDVSSEKLLEELSEPLELDSIDWMIRNLPPAQPSSIRRVPLDASLGTLEVFPAELLFLILDFLDFKSLSRLSRVSLKAKGMVESLPVNRKMMQHAPTVLTALGRTQLLSHHPAALIHKTLKSEKCTSCCIYFGGFLLLPTFERVCSNCLEENVSLRVTTATSIKECFHLTEKQLRTIPVMRSIPAIYGYSSRKRTYRLVSIKQAKKLAIEVHGSIENLAALMPTTRPPNMGMKKFLTFKQFHDEPMEAPSQDLSRLPEKADRQRDDFAGMASIPFPYLKSQAEP